MVQFIIYILLCAMSACDYQYIWYWIEVCGKFHGLRKEQEQDWKQNFVI